MSAMNPRVFTEGNKYEPEHLVKKSWGVIMIDGQNKMSVPWHRVQEIQETIER